MGIGVSCRRGNRRQKPSSLQSHAPFPPGSCVDINQATEEELMTLPGIGRALAQSITVHRRTIQGFRRVEDLALVTGVGAERMLELRPEICVGSFPPPWTEINGSGTIYDVAVKHDEESNTIRPQNAGQNPKPEMSPEFS